MITIYLETKLFLVYLYNSLNSLNTNFTKEQYHYIRQIIRTINHHYPVCLKRVRFSDTNFKNEYLGMKHYQNL